MKSAGKFPFAEYSLQRHQLSRPPPHFSESSLKKKNTLGNGEDAK